MSVLLLMTVPPGEVNATTAKTVSAAATETKSAAAVARQLRDAVRAALIREARAKTPNDRAAAVRELTVLYGRTMGEIQLTDGQRTRLRMKIRIRLKRVQKDWQRQSRREQKKAGRNHRSNTTDNTKAKLTAGDTSATALDSRFVTEGDAGAFAGAGRDFGQDLVELIEKTIAPDTWDVNGGRDTIMYYAPMRVLVVRQTANVGSTDCVPRADKSHRRVGAGSAPGMTRRTAKITAP